MADDATDYRAWIGSAETRDDLIAEAQVEAIAATLDLPTDALAASIENLGDGPVYVGIDVAGYGARAPVANDAEVLIERRIYRADGTEAGADMFPHHYVRMTQRLLGEIVSLGQGETAGRSGRQIADVVFERMAELSR